MTGNVILKQSLSAALQNAGGRKPIRPSRYPTTITKNTGMVAFRLNIRFCTSVASPLYGVHSIIHGLFLQGRKILL